MKYNISDTQKVNKVLIDEFNVQWCVKIYSPLPDYSDFRGFDFPNGADLTAISKRICEGFAKPSWLALKHHLLSMYVAKKLFKSLREISIRDKQDEFKQERLLQRLS